MSDGSTRSSVGFVGHGEPTGMYGLVRRAYRRGEPVMPESIDEPWAAGGVPRLVGAHPWLAKRFTDVVVHGDAYSPRPVSSMPVVVAVAGTAVRLRVWGERSLAVVDGRVQIGAAEPFTRMGLGWDRAYGGADLRVRPQCTTAEEAVELLGDHPGLYPRNPFGRGWLAAPGDIGGLSMPNVESADEPLTPDNLVLRDPAHWYRQPMPAGLGPLHPRMYAKMVHFGLDAWFPPPDDERLAEVRCGMLPAGWRRWLPAEPTHVPHPGLFQDAPRGLRFERLDPGAPIRVEGMHPEGKDVRWTIPAPPRIELCLEGRAQRPPPRLSLVRIFPAQEVLEVTWAVRSSSMHRIFVPGLHRRIPLELRVDG